MLDEGRSAGGAATQVPTGVVGRTLHVLLALGRAGGQTLTEVSEECGLNKATTLRFLRSLESEGFAKRDENGAWALTTLLWQLGCAAIDYDHTNRDVHGVLQGVVEATGETAVYALYEDGYTIYVDQVLSAQLVRTHIPLGSRVRATATATGLCVLAFQSEQESARVVSRDLADRDGADGARVDALHDRLAEVRRDGHAFNRDGIWQNVWGVAAPVADRRGQVLGAVGVSAPSDRQPADLTPVTGAVRSAAEHLTRIHGGLPVSPRRAGEPSSPEEVT